MKLLAITAFSFLITGVLSADAYQNSGNSNVKYNDQGVTTGSIVKVVNDPKLGKILTDNKGMTLYYFTKDKLNTSVCYDQCAETWPPFVVTSDQQINLPSDVPGTFSTIKRNDNTLQVAYNGLPLYYYVKDSKPGDTTGQNVDSEWYVINPVANGK